jgi:hypothetical protein
MDLDAMLANLTLGEGEKGDQQCSSLVIASIIPDDPICAG